MEPVTHLLTGACLARAGFNRKTAYATLAMTLAAEAPDLDILWQLRGPVAGFERHRALTHSLVGAPLVALAVTTVVWLLDRYLLRRKAIGRRRAIARGAPRARWLLIWLFAWIAVLSHIFLDWTNNYGVRPFFPFSQRWYSLDWVYIFDPVLFAALLLALVIPAILGMADREIGARPPRFRGRGWAIAGLLIAVALWTLRWNEHRRAIELAAASPALTSAPAPPAPAAGEPVLRIGAEPYPANPFHWRVVVETAGYYLTGSVDAWRSEVTPGGEDEPVFKPPVTAAAAAAKRSPFGRFYLGWAGFPVVADLGPAELAVAGRRAPSPRDSVVEFRDLRFAYPTILGELLNQSGGAPPLGATIYVAPSGAIDGVEMDGRLERMH